MTSTTGSLECQGLRAGCWDLWRLAVAQALLGQIPRPAWPFAISWSHLSSDLGSGGLDRLAQSSGTAGVLGCFPRRCLGHPQAGGCTGVWLGLTVHLWSLGGGGGMGPAGGLTAGRHPQSTAGSWEGRALASWFWAEGGQLPASVAQAQEG